MLPVPLPEPVEPLPLVRELPVPLFTTMICGVGFSTYPLGTFVSVTTTVLPGWRPVTVTVPSFPVVYFPMRMPLLYLTVNSVFGTGFPVTESTFVMVRLHRGSL